MSSTWSNNITFSVFGESHGPAIGVVMDNVPPGESIDMDKLMQFMARRAPKKDKTSTQRREKDMPQIMSGFFNGKTTGTPPLCIYSEYRPAFPGLRQYIKACPSRSCRLYGSFEVQGL